MTEWLLAWETSALARLGPEPWPRPDDSFDHRLTSFAIKELQELPDSLFKETLLSRAKDFEALPPATPETAALAMELAQELNLQPNLARHLAQAATHKATALVTDDPFLLSLPVLLAVSLRPRPFPLIVQPRSLNWPDPGAFDRWAAALRAELAKENPGLNLRQKTPPAHRAPKTAPHRPAEERFEDRLEPLSPDPERSLALWLDAMRRALPQ
ncbi:MAG: hypothetical protein LBE01_02595 [Deltaproteobacteria bacterium]|jgi:hypothetical protein|nr:hypothetical protein [Deltaproteobacteria bacterium]